MSAAAELIKKLRKNPNDPELLRKTARLLVSQPEMFVSNMLAHGLLEPRKLKSTAKWQNYCATQKCNPVKVAYPHTLDDLKAILVEAARLNCSVRAVGSAHAWSDVELTDGILIETHGIWRPLPLDPATLRQPATHRDFFHVEAGMTIKKANELLDLDGRALINMGGYDGQTVAGVISTSTHGSGNHPRFIFFDGRGARRFDRRRRTAADRTGEWHQRAGRVRPKISGRTQADARRQAL